MIEKKKIVFERDLAATARDCRLKAGISKAEAARRLGVLRSTIHQAEEYPGMSLTKLRVRMIETFSRLRVHGPFYIIAAALNAKYSGRKSSAS